MMLFLFFGSLALLFWAYAGYPAAMALLAKKRARPVHPDPAWCPSVTVIIPVRDEAKVIGPKLESVLAQGWPEERLEVLVVDDGSTDGTRAVVRGWSRRGVRLVVLPRSQGKAAALNRAVAEARGEILVLTDARQPLLPGALRALVAALGDASVGAVSGELELAPGAEGMGLYRRIDDMVRRCEAATGSSVGVTGALWAVRRALWTPLPEGTILDDLYQPLCVARQGRRVVIEPAARARDLAAPGGANEMARRVRTLTGNLQLVRALPWTLSPFANPMFFRLLSHKLLRLVAPLALVTLALSNLALIWRHPFFSFAMAGQILFYGLALLDFPMSARGPIARASRIARTFVVLHVAAAIAIWQFARGRERGLWRAPSTPVLSPPGTPRVTRTTARRDGTQLGWHSPRALPADGEAETPPEAMPPRTTPAQFPIPPLPPEVQP